MESIFKTIHFNPVDFMFQCINILVIIFFLNKFLFKRISKILEQRKNDMEKNLIDVENSWKKIKEKEDSYINLISNAKKESQIIIDDASLKGEKLKIQLIDKAKTEAKNILNQAKKDIENEKIKVLSSIQNEVSSIIIDSIKIILKKEINSDIHNQIVSNFIKKTEELN